MTQASPPTESAPPLRIPGPSRTATWGLISRLQTDPLGVYTEEWEAHGDFVHFPIASGLVNMVLLADPKAVEHVLSRKHANYRKPGFLLDAFRPIVGDGLFSAQGAVWKRKRRLIAPTFRRDRLLDMVPGIVSAADAHARAWADRDAQPQDVLADLTDLTLDVVSSVFFGATLGDDRERFNEALREGMVQVNGRLNAPFNLPLWIPTPANLRIRRTRDALRGVVERFLAEREGGGESPDLMTRLLAARDEEDGEGLSKLEMINEMLTLLVAGHDTSAAGIAWTLHLLAENPQVRSAVEDEIDAVLGGRLPTADDLPRLELTLMAFQEALRLYPPAWGQAREAIADDVVCGYRVPKRTILVPAQWLVHRSPKHWDEPERFDPLRFTPERVAARPRFAYFPFGGGPRLCIGRTLALLEAPLLLAVLLSRFRFESSDVPVEPDPTITLRPVRLVMNVVRRQGLSED